MIGKNPLWVARQHGHSVRTMLEVYAAWAEGAVESDVAAIEQAMGLAPQQGNSGGLLGSIRRHFMRSSTLCIQVKKPSFSIWHWIWHQKWGSCS
jgi:hypothetical protein